MKLILVGNTIFLKKKKNGLPLNILKSKINPNDLARGGVVPWQIPLRLLHLLSVMHIPSNIRLNGELT